MKLPVGGLCQNTINLPASTVRAMERAADSAVACREDLRLRITEIYQQKVLLVAKDSVIRGRGLMIRDLINEKRAEVALKENCEKQNAEYEKQAVFYEKAYKKERRKTRVTSIAGTIVTGLLVFLLVTK